MLKRVKSHNHSQIQEILLCVIAAAMLFKINLGNLAIILAVIYNLIFLKKENFIRFKSFSFLFPVFFFLITVISGLLSKDFKQGINSIDLNLLLVLIPFIIANSKIDNNTIDKIFKYFFYSSIISVTILLINTIFKISNGSVIDDIVFHEFTKPYDQHPVYYAMLLSLALFFVFLNGNALPKKFKIIGSFLLILGIILCASKAVIFVNTVAYILYFLFKKRGLKSKIYLTLILFFTIVTVYNIPFIKHRFVDGLRFHESTIEFKPTNNFLKKKIFNYEEKKAISDLELRYIMASVGVYHLIADDKTLTGYGHGDVQNYLDYYYYSYNLAPNWNEGRNIHNQYLHIFITYGIIVFLLFLSYIIFSFYIAIKHKNLLHLFFLALLAFVFIFEVMLVRNKGIVLFYFFNTIFLIKSIYIENSNFRHQRNP